MSSRAVRECLVTLEKQLARAVITVASIAIEVGIVQSFTYGGTQRCPESNPSNNRHSKFRLDLLPVSLGEILFNSSPSFVYNCRIFNCRRNIDLFIKITF